jgi:hypothetical protein
MKCYALHVQNIATAAEHWGYSSASNKLNWEHMDPGTYLSTQFSNKCIQQCCEISWVFWVKVIVQLCLLHTANLLCKLINISWVQSYGGLKHLHSPYSALINLAHSTPIF